ncbi:MULTISPECIES: hypothetical protein [unclassified Halomonas]|uniref:hypothetical protein n=1 Tax=unclassified Halomonas TaxID=2609666 RepID=UPI00209D6CF0|nr:MULTISPECIES: hypothetical protein [unclassified Halomonas]MCP1314164.1 hypothetical protein [Halomonas sp. 707D7]MCP1326570.1 hypothetical protein [Halomonas sp. 707D4]
MCNMAVNRLSGVDEAYLLCTQAATFEDFAAGVHILIDRAAARAEQNAHLQFANGSVEDGWTSRIIERLDGFGVSARPGTAGGNADIVIENQAGQFTIICESKVLGKIPTSSTRYDSGHLFEGVKQLVTRYTTGTVGQDHCILIIFCFSPKMKMAIERWKTFFFDKVMNGEDEEKEYFEDLDDYSFPRYSGLRGFFTTHTHHSSGYPVKVRHLPVCLHHQPIDKSAQSKS